MARQLNANVALDGSVLTVGERVRITVRLILAKTGEHLWAQEYERDLRDILALQSEVARAIVAEIRVTVTPQEKQRLAPSRPLNPEAYQAYLRGRHEWNRRTGEGLGEGMKFFQQAIDKDPGSALAYTGLADAFALLGSLPFDAMPPREAMPKARQLATRALELDDTLAEAHASLGYYKLSHEWDWAAAEKEFLRAIELNPGYATAHHWYAHTLLAAGRLEQALAEMKRAQELNPLLLIINVGVGWCYHNARRHDEAVGQYRKVLEIEPNFSLAHFALGLALSQQQSYEQAIQAFQKAIDLSGGRLLTAVAALGRAYALSGNRREAAKVLEQLNALAKKRYVPALYFAVVHAALGQREPAFEWVQKAFEERSEFLVYLKVEPALGELRADPRFADLMRRHRLN